MQQNNDQNGEFRLLSFKEVQHLIEKKGINKEWSNEFNKSRNLLLNNGEVVVIPFETYRLNRLVCSDVDVYNKFELEENVKLKDVFVSADSNSIEKEPYDEFMNMQ
jgi:hypothetical protein